MFHKDYFSGGGDMPSVQRKNSQNDADRGESGHGRV